MFLLQYFLVFLNSLLISNLLLEGVLSSFLKSFEGEVKHLQMIKSPIVVDGF